MKTKSALIAGLVATTVALFAPGCADTTQDLDEGAETSADGIEDSIESVDSPLNSNGSYCGGWCRTHYTYVNNVWCGNGDWFYYAVLPNVTQDCRARIVDFCHNRGWGFGDAYWSPGYPLTGYKCGIRS